MTNLEALQTYINLDLPKLHERVLEDNNLNPTAIYDNKSLIELCSAYVYKVEMTHPEFSEGKLRIKSTVKELKALMNNIFEKNNLFEEMVILKPKIKIEPL